MSSKFRNLISSKSRQLLTTLEDVSEIPTNRQIISTMKLVENKSAASPHPITFTLPISSLRMGQDPTQISRFIQKFETDTHIQSVFQAPGGAHLTFGVDRDVLFSRELAVQLRHEQQGYFWIRDGLFPEEKSLNIIVEYSSPNVAKPFHMGHLRSTILGNFVANINEFVGHKVNRINFLGDWGTQFGVLATGLEDAGTNLGQVLNPASSEESIKNLYHVYVEANKKSESDPSFADRAKTCFSRLENGDPNLLADWKAIRDVTVTELEKVYKRLGVTFDHYHGESMYGHEHSQKALEMLTDMGLLQVLTDGRKVVEVNDRQVVVSKSDGATLYITRDIAAAIDRQKMFEADKMIYVVEAGQSNHFENLFEILSKCQPEFANNLMHVKFGRIEGMSTRKGTAVFLSDILNEGRDQMLERSFETVNTRVESEEERLQVSDILATTAVIVNDLKQKRVRNYVFMWENALHSKGDSGIKLQYTHARLTTLLAKQNRVEVVDFINELISKPELASHLVEPEAVALVFQVARFGEVLRDTYLTLESSYLVIYLFRLCNVTSKAFKVLPVKGEAPDVSFARMALFASVRSVLRQGMKVLGVQPLDKM